MARDWPGNIRGRPSPSQGRRPRPKSRGVHDPAAAAHDAPRRGGSQETLGGGGGERTRASTSNSSPEKRPGLGSPSLSALSRLVRAAHHWVLGRHFTPRPGVMWVWLPCDRAELPPGRERHCRSRWSQRPWGRQGARLTCPSPSSCSASGRSVRPASCPASSAAGPAWRGPGTCPWSHCRGRGPLPG